MTDDWTRELTTYYHQNSLRWQRIRDVLAATIDDRLKQGGLNVHQRTSRVKTLESFVKKAQKRTADGGPTYSEPTTQIKDFVGLRYVVVLANDIPPVSQIIQGAIHVSQTKQHGGDADPGMPGYQSLHLVGHLTDDDPALLAEPALAGGDCVEIQIRSILQDAFASFSHDLTYKGEREPTLRTRRRMVVLASVLDLADREFAQVRAAHVDELSDKGEDSVPTSEAEAAATAGWTDETIRDIVRRFVGPSEDPARPWLAELRRVLTQLGLTPDDLERLGHELPDGPKLAAAVRVRRPWASGVQVLDVMLQRAFGDEYVERRTTGLTDRRREEFRSALRDEFGDVVPGS